MADVSWCTTCGETLGDINDQCRDPHRQANGRPMPLGTFLNAPKPTPASIGYKVEDHSQKMWCGACGDEVPFGTVCKSNKHSQRPIILDGDMVNHPSHYNKGKIECIEFLEDQGLGFHLGNAIKYLVRAGAKDPAKVIEDLKKAVWYIERKIELLTAEKESRTPLRPNDMPKRAT